MHGLAKIVQRIRYSKPPHQSFPSSHSEWAREAGTVARCIARPRSIISMASFQSSRYIHGPGSYLSSRADNT